MPVSNFRNFLSRPSRAVVFINDVPTNPQKWSGLPGLPRNFILSIIIEKPKVYFGNLAETLKYSLARFKMVGQEGVVLVFEPEIVKCV